MSKQVQLEKGDQKVLQTILNWHCSERLTFMLLARYFTTRSEYHAPEVCLNMLKLYRKTWMHEHALDEIAWMSQELGMYD